MTLERLSLSRSTLDRAAHRRADPRFVAGLLAADETAVLLLDVERAPVAEGPDGARLALLAAKPATEFAATAWSLPDPLALYLGDVEGREHVVLARTLPPRKGAGFLTPQPPDEVAAPDGTRWADLRQVGAVLDDTGAGLLTAAVALAHWHAAHPRCSRCGAATAVIQSGWARQCPECGAEHYPRTDGAVIMAVADADDRILLGSQARWPEKRYSCLAGFVEPGESLEAAVAREVFEESGVVVGEVEYKGSQPWPFPASLMLGFAARAVSTEITVDGAELSSARWWSREELALDVATGELLLPPGLSIARRLIEDWYGSPIRDGGEAWR